ncbi:hypothetical protein [Streptomyces sp. C36]|uniref:hypothetical protein n=1 Tax=Streptomyces sp. C36 TaxID=3237122 RepID=UPI0034C5F544
MPAPNTINPPPAWLKTWIPAFDTVRKEVGVVTGIGDPFAVDEVPTTAYLRPEQGGTEWQCEIAKLEPVLPPSGSAHEEQH